MKEKKSKSEWIDDKCPACNGTGVEIVLRPVPPIGTPKISPLPCPQCHGTGRIKKEVRNAGIRFQVTFEMDGREITQEIDMPSAEVDKVALENLLRRLLRLQPGQQLSIPHDELDAISSDDLQRVAAIGNAGIQCGCKVSMDEAITDDPQNRGVIFTRTNRVPPLLEHLDPEGSA